MPEIESRPATEHDREFVHHVKWTTLRYAIEATWGWDEETVRRRGDAHFRPEETRILLEGGEPVGYLKVRREPDAIHLASIYLLPPWQSRGLGTSIVNGLIEEGARCGKPVRLRVLRANERARALYERLGFRVTETTETHHLMRTPARTRDPR